MWCPEDAACEHMWRTSTKMQTLAPSWNEAQEVPPSAHPNPHPNPQPQPHPNTNPNPNPKPNPNPNQVPLSRRRALMHVVLFDWDKVGTDDFLGEALLALDEYLDGARHSLKLELDQLKGNHTQHDSPVTGFVEIELSAAASGRGALRR